MFAIPNDSRLVVLVGWILIHSLWQFTLIAVTAVGLQSVIRPSASTVRYAIGLLAICLVVISPFVTCTLLPDSSTVANVHQQAESPIGAATAQSPSAIKERFDPHPAYLRAPQQPKDAVPATTPATQFTRSNNLATTLGEGWRLAQGGLQPWLPTIVIMWWIGVLICALRPLASWFAVRRLRTVNVDAVPPALDELVRRLAIRLDLKRRVQVLQSALIEVPIVLGCVRPVILIPVSVAIGLTPTQLEAVLAHELAHVRRHDYLVNLLQTLVETVFFYHPCVWWLSHRLRIERENCCDDLAVSLLGNRRNYGRALLALEELRDPSTALALSARGGSLLSRIQRILHRDASRNGMAVGMTFGVSLVLLLVIVMGVWTATRAANSEPNSRASDDQTPAVSAASASNTEQNSAKQTSGATQANNQKSSKSTVAQTTQLNPRKVAQHTAERLTAKRFDQVAQSFSSDLARELSAEQLQNLWGKIAAAAGPFEQFRRVEFRRVGDRMITDQRTTWDKADVTIGLLIDSDGKISGIQIRNTPDRAPVAESVLPRDGLAFGSDLKKLLAAKGTISAKILDVDGKPQSEVNVILWKEVPSDDTSADVWRPNDGTAWKYLDGMNDPSTHFAALPAGRYRVSARTRTNGSRRSGFSSPIKLESNDAQAEAVIQFQSGSQVILRVLNDADQKAMPDARATLTRAEHDWPYTDFHLDEQKENDWVAQEIPPGRYLASADQRAQTPDGLTYGLPNKQVEVDIPRAGETVRRDLVLHGRNLTKEEIDQRWPWIVEGTVRDADGRPMANVEVWASAGWGTLHRTGSTRSDAAGNYHLRFGPGIFMYHEQPDPLDIQAGIIHAHLPGYTEGNLNRQGDLLAANRAPKPNELQDSNYQPDRLIIAGQPRRVDFVMVPAAKLMIRVQNAEQKPLAKWHVSLVGEVLPPASSVVESGESDASGVITFDHVPVGYAWRFDLRAPESRQSEISPLLKMKQAGEYDVLIRQSTDVTTQLRSVEFVSIENASRLDVKNDLLVADPRTARPVSAEKQTAAKELLKRLAQVNHDWLIAPPEEIKNYRYRFQRPEAEARQIDVDPRSSKNWTDIRGTAYTPAVGTLSRFADKLVFRQFDERDGKTYLFYVAGPDCPALRMDYGIGVAGKYGPYTSRGFQEGTLIIDMATSTVLEHRTRELVERFDSFVSTSAGRLAPTRVRIELNGKLIHDWRFAVYGPGLWLLDQALDNQGRVAATVEQIEIDGQPQTAKQRYQATP